MNFTALIFAYATVVSLGLANLFLAIWLANRVRRLARLCAEIEHQECMDRILLDRPKVGAPDLEQSTRADVAPEAARIMRESMGSSGYEQWLARVSRVKAHG